MGPSRSAIERSSTTNPTEGHDLALPLSDGRISIGNEVIDEARRECAMAVFAFPEDVSLPKSAVLALMEQSFIRGATWALRVLADEKS